MRADSNTYEFHQLQAILFWDRAHREQNAAKREHYRILSKGCELMAQSLRSPISSTGSS